MAAMERITTKCLNCHLEKGKIICDDCNAYLFRKPVSPVGTHPTCLACGCFYKPSHPSIILCETCTLLKNKIYSYRKIVRDPLKIGTEGRLPGVTITDEEHSKMVENMYPKMAIEITFCNRTNDKYIIYKIPLLKFFKKSDFDSEGNLLTDSPKIIYKAGMYVPPPDIVDFHLIHSAKLIRTDMSPIDFLWSN
jgi:hypothetical protein